MLQLNTNIKLIRELSGKTQGDFAKLIKTNVSNLKTYENTAVKPKANVLYRISELAGISMEDLENKKLKPSDIHFKGDKDEIVENRQNEVKQDYLSGKNLDNFSEAHKKLVDTNSELALAIVRALPESRQDQGLAPKFVELIREAFSGKKQISFDELSKLLDKAGVSDNGYKR